MKTRINVYGLTVVSIIVFFICCQKWKYDNEKEELSQLKQAEYFDKLRFAGQSLYAEEVTFKTAMGTIPVEGDKESAVQVLKAIQDELEQKHKSELDNDNRRIEEFSRDHGF